MDAIVMAGGLAQRLGPEEKACVMLIEKPLISYLLDALIGAKRIDRVFVQTSPYSPVTEECVSDRYNGNVHILRTPGDNYVGDMVSAVKAADSVGPVMILMPDLPLVTPEHIDTIIESYDERSLPAMSVCAHIGLFRELGLRPGTVFNKNGEMLVPVGINILDSKNIDKEQIDFDHLTDIPEVAINIDSVDELAMCKKILLDRSISSI